MSSTGVGLLLRQLGYRLQSVRKRQEGTTDQDRSARLERINAAADQFLSVGDPATSVDTKKKESVGDFKNGGRQL